MAASDTTVGSTPSWVNVADIDLRNGRLGAWPQSAATHRGSASKARKSGACRMRAFGLEFFVNGPHLRSVSPSGTEDLRFSRLC
jgi:hypothetical protein